MERLPYIDDHAVEIAAPPEAVWEALLPTLRGAFGRVRLPRVVVAAWGLQQRAVNGDWPEAVAVGDALPGFQVVACEPPSELALRGAHRFARYELRFRLESDDGACTELHASTRAVFPGVHGRLYRALVIGSRGHRIVVRRLLRQAAARALQPSRVGARGRRAHA